MKKIYSIISLSLFVLVVNAQHLPHYTQYMYNMHILNPAYAGARADLSIGLLSRMQWVGVEGAPKTSTLAVSGRISGGLAFGLTAVNDRLGLYSGTNLNLDMSYTLALSRYDRLALGIKGGMEWYQNKLSQGITPDDETYPDRSGSAVDAGAGVYYYNEILYLGLSVPSLVKSGKFSLDNTVPASGDNINFFLTGGALFELNGDMYFKPSAMLKYVFGAPLSVDINANLLYREKLEFGLSYRYGESVSGLVALILNKQFRIGYTYDFTLNGLGTGYGDSHELMLLYDLKLKRRGRWLDNSPCYF